MTTTPRWEYLVVDGRHDYRYATKDVSDGCYLSVEDCAGCWEWKVTSTDPLSAIKFTVLDYGYADTEQIAKNRATRSYRALVERS